MNRLGISTCTEDTQERGEGRRGELEHDRGPGVDGYQIFFRSSILDT